MSYRDVVCSQCNARMEQGFIINIAEVSEATIAEWHPGEVEYKTFLGLEAGIKTNKSQMLKIVTYRCPKCGLLRSYAPSTEI